MSLRIDADYGHYSTLGHLTQAFQPNTFYCLRGPNGSGKSTILATLAGELEPISGTVTLNHVPPGDKANSGKIISVSEPEFLPDLSVSEHFTLIAKHTGVDFQPIFEKWRITDLLERPAFHLSSGQRQRVFLALQLYQPCDVLLIDEPERHLDADWAAFLTEELVSLSRDARVIITASHSPTVLSACDQAIELV